MLGIQLEIGAIQMAQSLAEGHQKTGVVYLQESRGQVNRGRGGKGMLMLDGVLVVLLFLVVSTASS